MYTENDVITAMCLWEAVIDDECRGDNLVNSNIKLRRELVGTCQLREEIMHLAPFVNKAYDAIKYQYDEVFDWEFVPRFLEVLDGRVSKSTPITITQENADVLAQLVKQMFITKSSTCA